MSLEQIPRDEEQRKDWIPIRVEVQVEKVWNYHHGKGESDLLEKQVSETQLGNDKFCHMFPEIDM